MTFNSKHLNQLLQANKIRGFKVIKRRKGFSQSKEPVIPREKCKGILWLELNLAVWANENALTLEEEYKFHDKRKWRFDFCFPALKIAVEYNGIMSEHSRHTSIKGYSKDMEKMNAAQSLGWKVLCYTPLNYPTAIKDLNKIYDKK